MRIVKKAGGYDIGAYVIYHARIPSTMPPSAYLLSCYYPTNIRDSLLPTYGLWFNKKRKSTAKNKKIEDPKKFRYKLEKMMMDDPRHVEDG